MSVSIIPTTLNWKRPRVNRSSTKYLIIHHAAALGSVYDIHNLHYNDPTSDYIGIAYNFYIRTDGSVYEGRGWNYEGGHTTNYNTQSIGICCEGNYDENHITIGQLRSVIELGAEALRRYPTITSIGGHNDYNATACPGQYFPKAMVIKAIRSHASIQVATNTLAAKRVIATPEYWRENYWRVEFLDELLINCADKCKSTVTGNITTVTNALNRLAGAGIINTPGYWINNYYKLQYLEEFIISAANHA